MATSLSKVRPLKRVFIANRGEIAVRIIRAARECGMESVAVYAEPDAMGMHVRLADVAIRLPGTTPAETYLNVPALVSALKASGADCVHPGYGFLSESSVFCEAVRAAGAEFVGPTPQAMHLMGDKIEAKRLMIQHHVPVVPGSDGPLTSVDLLKSHAQRIGYPLILKAAAGGGGRGMRVVRQDSELAEALAACSREALAYFGNAEVFCERYIENPRHIEFQVLFDQHGNGVHLFERDCSIQRRHQKLIEEAPSAYLDDTHRHRLGEIAVRAAAAAGYVGAGTVEFICESPDRAYFMEMNTRIQVEHPVTEAITGIDLISMQLRVAAGETLPFKQSDIKIRGWAVETRINAEDPAKGFAPAPGRVTHITFPSGPGVRVDSHLYSGYEIPQQYDSMIAKLIVTGTDRSDALKRTLRALRELRVEGVPTTVKFHEALLKHPDFLRGTFTTRFIEDNAPYFKQAFAEMTPNLEQVAALLAAVLYQSTLADGGDGASAPVKNTATPSLWSQQARLHGRRRS